MDRTKLTDTQLVGIWEDQRDIKNLMGRFTRCLMHKEEGEIFDRFWSSRDDICLGVNDGWYCGSDSIKRYYRAAEEKRRITDRIIRNRFPAVMRELPEAAYGFGYMELKSLSSDLVVIAEDGATAQGMWQCAGEMVEFSEVGPVSYLTFGTYAVDFIRENDQWRIWHMRYMEEIKHPQGEKWWEPAKVRTAFPEFAELAEFEMPAPDQREILWQYFTLDRAPQTLPHLPHEYASFHDNISYGIRKEAFAG